MLVWSNSTKVAVRETPISTPLHLFDSSSRETDTFQHGVRLVLSSSARERRFRFATYRAMAAMSDRTQSFGTIDELRNFAADAA